MLLFKAMYKEVLIKVIMTDYRTARMRQSSNRISCTAMNIIPSADSKQAK